MMGSAGEADFDPRTLGMTDKRVFDELELPAEPGQRGIRRNIITLDHTDTAYDDRTPEDGAYVTFGGSESEPTARVATLDADPTSRFGRHARACGRPNTRGQSDLETDRRAQSEQPRDVLRCESDRGSPSRERIYGRYVDPASADQPDGGFRGSDGDRVPRGKPNAHPNVDADAVHRH